MFTISEDKLKKVVEIFNREVDQDATRKQIKDDICSDWNEGADHQTWIDTADAQEISDWLAISTIT